MKANQVREVTTNVLRQTVKVVRSSDDGMVWLYAPQGVALTPDEAWAVSQAMIAGTEPDDLERTDG